MAGESGYGYVQAVSVCPDHGRFGVIEIDFDFRGIRSEIASVQQYLRADTTFQRLKSGKLHGLGRVMLFSGKVLVVFARQKEK
jgi:hypothetical protein